MSQPSTPRRARTRMLAVGLAAAVALLGGVVSPVAVPEAHAAGLGAGGEFIPVTPARIVDSRLDLQLDGPLAYGQEYSFQVTGATDAAGNPSGIPATDVLAVMANITVTSQNRTGYLSAYSSGYPAPNASNVNFDAGRDVPNLALLRPGADGRVTVKIEAFDGKPPGSSTADVIVDVVGWFATSAAGQRGARLVSLEPGRVLDTRNGVARSGALGPGEQFKLQVRGADSPSTDYIPDDPNVSAVILNTTVVAGNANTFVSAQPEPFTGFPTTSSVNLRANEVKANLVVVPVAADGTISFFNEQGNAHLIADVVGYFRSGVNDESRAGRIVPIATPFRVIDTRADGVKLGPDAWEVWDLDDDEHNSSFVDSVKLDGVWVGDISSLMMNLTIESVVCPCVPSNDRNTFLYAFPDPGDPSFDPDNRSSNLNTTVGRGPIANFTVARLSSEDKLGVYNKNGYVHYLADVAAVVLE